MKRNQAMARAMRKNKPPKNYSVYKYSPTYNRWKTAVLENKMSEAARLSREHYNIFVINRTLSLA